MHLGIARLGGVLGRRRRVDDRCIDDRAGRDLQPLGREVSLDLIEQLPAQIVLFEQMTKAAYRGLVAAGVLVEAGLRDLPERLTFDRLRVPERIGPEVFFSQTCGYPLETIFSGQVDADGLIAGVRGIEGKADPTRLMRLTVPG
jgi:hypothetical protein